VGKICVKARIGGAEVGNLKDESTGEEKREKQNGKTKRSQKTARLRSRGGWCRRKFGGGKPVNRASLVNITAQPCEQKTTVRYGKLAKGHIRGREEKLGIRR